MSGTASIGEADALSDGEHVYIPSVMEHVELAGVHSGDSACIIPPVTITKENLATIKDYTRKIAEALHVCGLMNMQYAIEDGKVFVLEANPRASRTVPLVSKVCNTPVSRRRLVLTSRRRREWSVSGTVCKCPPRNAPHAW